MTILKLDDYESFGTQGSGNQTKFWINNQLVKLDSKFKESDKEVSASILASIFELNHVDYTKIKTVYKNQIYNACICDSFFNRDCEEEVTLYTILNLYNINIVQNESAFSYFNKVIDVIHKLTNLDKLIIIEWLISILTFDFLVCNTDRHLNNLSLIYNFNDNTYRLGPIFDCGYSFLSTNSDLSLKEIESRCRKLKFKPFSTNEKYNLVNINYAKNLALEWETIGVNKYGSLINIPMNSIHNKIFRYRLNKLKNL